ncbi:restless-like transposase [Trichoderma arundinaceum]|uniref:Restless-like transposase n=1 Tax=Trichoderma arundinaceum TaxID=490622 RepID=A0A395NGL7_TRIAR|nr:restless-like transposase [Trichoderma arundinaceum]
MAPITCKVVDTHNVGVEGVHVIMDCRDRFHNHTAKLESLTDVQGGISFWYPFPASDDVSALEPQIADAIDIPRVSLTFYPHPRLMAPHAPWVSIRADLYLPGATSHGVVLHLEDNPRLEYTAYPVSGPIGQLALPVQVMEVPRTPSPLLISPPLLTCSSYTSSSDDDYEPTADDEDEEKDTTTRGRKRKRDLESGKALRARRQRTK